MRFISNIKTGTLKKEGYERALNRIAEDIVLASKNSVYVIESLNSIVQNPENYPNPELLIKEWLEYLFQADFRNSDKEFIIEKNKIENSNVEKLFQFFFNYFLSLIPFYFDETVVKSPNHNKYKWSKEEFLDLKKALMKSRYDEIWNLKITDANNFKETNKDSKYSLEIMNNSSRIKRKKWNKNDVNWIYQTNEISHFIEQIRYKNEIYFKEDIIKESLNLFLPNLSSKLDNYISDFYYSGTYLHNYFRWNNEN